MDEFEIKIRNAPQGDGDEGGIVAFLERMEEKAKALFMRRWLVVASSVAAAVVLFGTPHIGWEYRCAHRMTGPNTCREYLSCSYLGIQGWREIIPREGQKCGVMMMLTPDWARLFGRN